MSILREAPLYLGYAVSGTGAAALARAALQQALRRRWLPALVRFGVASALLGVSIGTMVVLIGSADLSVFAPVSTAVNLLAAGIIAVVVLGEAITPVKAGGMVLMVVGVGLLA